MTAIQNIGLLVFPYLNGKLRDATHGYACEPDDVRGPRRSCGLVFAVLLLRADRRAGHVLERPTEAQSAFTRQTRPELRQLNRALERPASYAGPS